jgi:hypothetical protein
MIEGLKGIGIVLGGWAFAASIRDEADLEALSARLLTVVSEMVKSERAALWLVPRIATERQ